MSNWARRMHRRAATLSNVVTSCGHPNSLPYPRRLEKVKFGVPLHEVCKDDIPGPLLVLILKLNKEAPLRRDVFRAPGHQGAMKKLIHFLQTGRLVNVDNYSVYTIASVLKKFLRKIPGGVFGREGEMQLFTAVELPEREQVNEIRRLLLSLPICTQKLLVLLFGTFRVMASNADKAGTGMTSEALGVSVAPSFFHSCVSDGKTATMEDVQRFKVILDLDIHKGVPDEELERCVKQVLRYSVKTDKGTFRNQLYGGTDIYGLSGAWIAEAFNTSQYTFEVAPVFTLIELKVLSHVLNLFGIPDGDGIFSPGGSMSMLYAITAARFKAFPQVKTKGMRNLREMVLFTSEDSHYSIKKAAHWLGFGTDNVRFIRANENGQMVTEELEAAIESEIEAGKHPLMVNATAGTTVLGAIDELNAIADICKKFDVWMHVDACWGGSLILSSTHRYKLQGIARANSLSWNPHKMVGAPLQCSIFLVRQKGLLHEANASAAQYLFQQDKFYDVSYDTGDKSVQCGRKIDAFKLWMMWKARGDAGLHQLADHTMKIALFCFETVGKRPGFRLVADKLQCPNVCFWFIPEFMRGKLENEKWWDLMHKITPKIKELLTLNSQLMVAYSPLRHHKNFFRLAFTFHPKLDEEEVLGMLQSIQDCGEKVTVEML